MPCGSNSSCVSLILVNVVHVIVIVVHDDLKVIRICMEIYSITYY